MYDHRTVQRFEIQIRNFGRTPVKGGSNNPAVRIPMLERQLSRIRRSQIAELKALEDQVTRYLKRLKLGNPQSAFDLQEAFTNMFCDDLQTAIENHKMVLDDILKAQQNAIGIDCDEE